MPYTRRNAWFPKDKVIPPNLIYVPVVNFPRLHSVTRSKQFREKHLISLSSRKFALPPMAVEKGKEASRTKVEPQYINNIMKGPFHINFRYEI